MVLLKQKKRRNTGHKLRKTPRWFRYSAESIWRVKPTKGGLQFCRDRCDIGTFLEVQGEEKISAFPERRAVITGDPEGLSTQKLLEEKFQRLTIWISSATKSAASVSCSSNSSGCQVLHCEDSELVPADNQKLNWEGNMALIILSVERE